MNMADIIRMAVHNLRFRKARTLLNLLGIVVGCIVLLMTAAGVRGVKEAVRILFDSSETARQIGLVASSYSVVTPPDEAMVVEGEMSPERRERIRQQLEWKWQRENRPDKRWELNDQSITELEKHKKIVSVVPEISVRCRIEVPSRESEDFDADAPPQSISVQAYGADPASGLLKGRLIAGDTGAEEYSEAGLPDVLLDEFTAYQLGYRSDEEVESLIGRPIRLIYESAPPKQRQVFQMLTENWGDLSTGQLAQQAQFMSSIATVMSELDKTSLTEAQKDTLRSLFEPPGQQLKETPSVTLNARVAGVLMEGDSDGIARLFRGHWHEGYGNVGIHSKLANQIFQDVFDQDTFHGAMLTVNSTQDLAEIEELLENQGATTYSAVRIIEAMERSIDESAWVVLGIAAAILLTAGIGISNTLLVSVLERTPEFGIMKSVGATDRALLWLMVCEGAILGFAGALIATLLSFVVGWAGQSFLQMYLEYRLGGEVASTLFRFGPIPIAIVFVVSLTICVLASIFPAWRAAKLDPIVAMQRS
ncbi:MAG TPA: hypothetical protein DDW52_27945 [Planctomycetaceae bacterium]|nr:hypothetical protein [Planctomycetaceae bacterium]